jgi:hypothetical protein
MLIRTRIWDLAAAACISFLSLAVHAQDPAYTSLLVPPGNLARVDSRLAKARGPVQVLVRLKGAPLAAALGPNAKRLGSRLTPDQQRAYLRSLVQQQNQTAAQIQGLGGQILARVNKVHNVLAVRIDAARLNQVAALANVAAIRPVID